MADDTPTIEAIRARNEDAKTWTQVNVKASEQAQRDIAWLLDRDAAREKRLAELEAELAGIRERARRFIAGKRDRIKDLQADQGQCGIDLDVFHAITDAIDECEGDIAEISGMVGDLGEPAAREGEGDAG